MLSEEYNGSLCEITDLDNKLIATGITKVLKEVVEVHDAGGNLPILMFGTQVKLSVHNPQLGMRVVSGRVYVSDHEFLRVVELETHADHEKRQFFRLTVDHSADLYPASDWSKSGGHRVERTPIRVKDISLCGMQFESEKLFCVGDRFRVRIALQDNLLETLDFVIRRVIPHENGKTRYGCEFLELTSHAEQRLCAYIFNQQQRQIRRSRG